MDLLLDRLERDPALSSFTLRSLVSVVDTA